MSDPTIQKALDLGATFLRKANSAWACGEPLHRVRDMLDAADAFQKALDALSTPTTPDEGEEARAREVLQAHATATGQFGKINFASTDWNPWLVAVDAMLAFRPSEGKGLRKALEPFARAADEMDKARAQLPLATTAKLLDASVVLPVEFIYAARAALKGER